MPHKSLHQFDGITTELLSNVLVIKFTRPPLRNPLSVAILEKLHQILDEAALNKSIEKMIFTGEEEIFASGADLREIDLVTAENAREFALRGQSLMAKIRKTNQITVAAVNGFCFGGALDLALACQKRIAASGAVFSHPGANLGIITGWGGTQMLPCLIGEAKALEMFLTAKRVSAPEALHIGLIDEIAQEPLARALQIR